MKTVEDESKSEDEDEELELGDTDTELYQLSESARAFIETLFKSKLDNATRKACSYKVLGARVKVAKMPQVRSGRIYHHLDERMSSRLICQSPATVLA